MRLRWLTAVFIAALAIPAAAGAAPTAGANVSVDQDHGLAFPQNKQNENSITRDPLTGVLVAGANDEIGLNLCTGTTVPLASPCPFTPGVAVSAYYRSTDGGSTWTGGLLPTGSGFVPGGDPSLDYGPRRCSDGASWWAPALATSTDRKSQFDDHEWIAVDRSSAHFGRLYLFWAVFCNTCAGNGNVKLYVAHSDDEGRSFTRAAQIAGTAFNLVQGQRETGQMAVSSTGIVEAFWPEHADSKGKYPTTQVVAVSTDGGDHFSDPIPVAPVVDYPLTGTPFDVVDLFNRVPGMSARVDCYPQPAADPSSARVYVVWCDFAGGHGVVKAAVSTDGVNWTSLGTIADVPERNAFFPAVAIAPNGTVAVAFNALTAPPVDDPWSPGTQVYDNYFVESVDGGAAFTAPLRVSSVSSNPEASAYNNLMEQFIGDYIGIVAGPTQAYVVWTDARDASTCQAVSDYQSAVYAGTKGAVAPNPGVACSTSFGNTDSEFAAVNY